MVGRLKFFIRAAADCFEIAGFASCLVLVFLGLRKPNAPRLAVKFRLTPLKSFSRDSGVCRWSLLITGDKGVEDWSLDGWKATATLWRTWSSAKRPQGKSASLVVPIVCQKKQWVMMAIKRVVVKNARVQFEFIWKKQKIIDKKINKIINKKSLVIKLKDIVGYTVPWLEGICLCVCVACRELAGKWTKN